MLFLLIYLEYYKMTIYSSLLTKIILKYITVNSFNPYASKSFLANLIISSLNFLASSAITGSKSTEYILIAWFYSMNFIGKWFDIKFILLLICSNLYDLPGLFGKSLIFYINIFISNFTTQIAKSY